jgi:DNA-binding Xre family transcriptional regulator
LAKVVNRLTEVIEETMKKHGIEHDYQMADKLGIDPAQFSRLKRMKPGKLVNVDILDKLYEEFGITPNDVLLHGTYDRSKRNSKG